MMGLNDLRVIAKDLGLLLILVALALLIPIPVAVYYNELWTVDDFLLAAVLSAAIGGLLYLSAGRVIAMELKHSIALIVLFWPAAAILGALPLVTTGAAPSFLDGLFEGMAGWTTTGLTTIGAFADDFPNSVNIWRALMQFLGGLGIILISIVVLSQARTGSESISLAATELTPSERVRPSIRNTAKAVFFLFLGFLLVSTVLLLLAGMPLFDAVFHGMTGLSTGGFSTHASSIAFFDSGRIELATATIMFIASTNFAVHIAILSGNFREIFRNIESRTFIILLIIFTTLATLSLFAMGGVSDEVLAVRKGFYQVLSALTSTGWTTVSSETISLAWPGIVLFLLIILMLIGGSTSSASGGLRLARFALILKSIWWHIKRALVPGSVVFPRTYHHVVRKTVTDRRMMDIYIFASVYFMTVAISTLILLAHGYGLEQSFFECVSAISTTGMSSGLASVDLAAGAKITLIVNMWIGRIEIIPFLMFISSFSRRFR